MLPHKYFPILLFFTGFVKIKKLMAVMFHRCFAIPKIEVQETSDNEEKMDDKITRITCSNDFPILVYGIVLYRVYKG